MAAERKKSDRSSTARSEGPAVPGRDGSDSLLRGFHQRLRRLLREVEGVIRDPARPGASAELSGPASLEAEKALAEMKLGLEAALGGAASLQRALDGEDALPPILAHLDQPLPSGLPETVERFLRERSRRPGFEYRLENDMARGWTLVWKQRDADGHLLGAGHLFERPFSPPGR